MKVAEKAAARTLVAPIDRALVRRESRHAVRYGIVGVSNVAIDFALYALLVSLGVWYRLGPFATRCVPRRTPTPDC